jgi:hypothetical protein
LKGIVARWFSWSAFVVAQVVIDCESLYYLATRQHPVHRTLHTFAGAALMGVATVVALVMLRRLVDRIPRDLIDDTWRRMPALEAELSTVGIWVGALAGALSHPLLDGLMHGDMRPFLPLTDANPLLGLISLQTLHAGCLVAGAIGFVLAGVWLYRESRSG